MGGVTFEGDGTGLIDVWDEADDEVVVVDAGASGGTPGAIRRFDARAAPLPAHSLRSSSHHFGVADAVELARSLDRLPPALRVYAIEGEDFGAGRSSAPPCGAPWTGWPRSSALGRRGRTDPQSTRREGSVLGADGPRGQSAYGQRMTDAKIIVGVDGWDRGRVSRWRWWAC